MNVPILGYGLGIGTNAGAALIKGDMFSIFNAESGFGLIIGECGLILGGELCGVDCCGLINWQN